ncbi:FecCD family ABC transporter permease [Microbacterium sp. bgisy207]|uniref:FecCD family ABC transporter permease n=1 Tax=Microbacterium sp. bgisy207 TaxID=3413800 RepID=UPI003EBDF698
MTATATPTPTVSAIALGRRSRRRRWSTTTGILALLVLTVIAVSTMVGHTFYSPQEVLRVILGDTVPGASFTVGELRLPRAMLALFAGFAFGMAGVTFQTMLRNPLASPDVIGISAGASFAAVTGIIVFSLSDLAVSVVALVGALVTATAIYLLADRRGFAGARLILIGIGIAAMIDSLIAYQLSGAAEWDLQAAMQWLAGSLNNASWERLVPLAIVMLLVVPVMLARSADLDVLRLGDDSAAALGVRVAPTRMLLIIGAVILLAFATAATGPIAFVAFMAGPIAARLLGPGSSLLLPAGLVGALLVLVADLVGQFAFASRYPVGVITGILGAPYLVYLLVRTHRSGGSL